MSEISIQTVAKSRIDEVDFNNIPFGRIFSDHMFEIDYLDGKWVNPHIKPFGNLSLSPALSCMHYGQAIFEGMKATKNTKGDIMLFRPMDNWNRLNESARRMQMPELPEELFMDALETLVLLERDWIPTSPNSALYIRPLMIATDDYLGVKASDSYKFLIYGTPVLGYYNEPLRIRVEEHYVRAALGGVGEAKAAGNYAASMYPASMAHKDGFHQLLWTDALEHKYIEELGTSNFFAVIGGELYTPAEDGTILKGITRDSVIQIAKSMGVQVKEIKLSVDFLVKSYEAGSFTEAFATGTAAAVAPIELIQFRNTPMNLQVGNNSLAVQLGNQITKIKQGDSENFKHWCRQVAAPSHQSNL
jgi:branched-chain amino acid aminotransferase